MRMFCEKLAEILGEDQVQKLEGRETVVRMRTFLPVHF